MCQIPIKMLKQHVTPNSSLHNLKIYSSKGCRSVSCDYDLINYGIINYFLFNKNIFSRVMRPALDNKSCK